MTHIRFATIFLYSWSLWYLKTAKCETALAYKKDITDFSDSIATEVDTFKELVEKSKVFVDTTSLIREILKRDSTDLEIGIHSWLWLAPPKSGKTMNLDMIKTFFEIQVDPNGEEYESREITSNYKLIARGEIQSQDGVKQHLTSPLAISANKTLMDLHQGQHPVIQIKFKNVQVDFKENSRNASAIKDKIKFVISQAFKQHEYMINALQLKYKENNDNKTLLDLKRFQDFLHEKDDEIERSVAFLSRVLENHFKRRVIILLDDYDTPVLHVIKEKALQIDSIFDIMKLLTFKIIDSAEYVFVMIVTGKYKIEAQHFYTTKYLVQKDDPTSEYFGFNEKTVRTLLEKHQINDQLSRQVRKWYDGYESKTKTRFYNPLSIAKFLKTKEIAVYFIENSYTDYIQSLLRQHPRLRPFLLTLLSRQAVDYEAENTGDLRYKLYNLLILSDEKNRNTWDEHSKKCFDKFFWYFLKEGYITMLSVNPSKPWLHGARLLNNEMGYIIADRLIHLHKQEYSIKENLLATAAQTLRDFIGSESTTNTDVQESFTNLYKDVSYNITDMNTIRWIFFTVVLQIQCNSKFEIDVYYNKTRDADIVMIDQPARHAAIIDFTFNNGSAEKALKMAESRGGIFNASHNFQRVKLFGINFTPEKTVDVLVKLKN